MQRRELAAFIADLYAASGCATWAEFAERAKVHWASLSDWKRGASTPDGYNLFKLIRVAGADATSAPGGDVFMAKVDWLAEAHGWPAGATSAGAPSAGLLRELVAAVAELRDAVADIVDRLELGDAAGPPAAVARGRRRSAR
jgi:hypothetical protein